MIHLRLLFVVAALTAACGQSIPEQPAGIVRDPAPEVGDVSLPDLDTGGSDFPFIAADGEILVVYFGYTSCPDVCPTTLADLRRAMADLDDAERVDVAMATVDPERDTPEVISGYLHSFFPEGHPLRTEDDAELRAAADAFGADYEVTTSEDGDVEVAHTGFLYAVDDAGELALTWPFGTTWEDMQGDLLWLLDGD